jgi:hypothetical protein
MTSLYVISTYTAMRKLFILLILFSAMTLRGQELFTPKTMLGISGGMGYSQLFTSPFIGISPLQGYVGGIVFKHISEPHTGIQLELNYIQKGWDEKLDAPNVYSRRFNYLEFAPLSHFEFGKRNTNLLLHIGPTFSYLLNDSITEVVTENFAGKVYYHSKMEGKIELGLCVGIGITQSTGIGDFQLECRFNQAINNVFSSSDVFSYSTNQVLTAKLSYMVRIDRLH